MRPLAIDLFCGLGGWTDGLLAEGWDVIGFDIERHQYGEHRYPAQLVIQDVRTLHGSQFRGADLIVASPPCQAYSYRAMPWKRAKALPPPCNALFDACFRIQREACDAAGRHIPLIVENVRGAQPWVGRARWNYGSFYLWGDVPALMPAVGGLDWKHPDDPRHRPGQAFNPAAQGQAVRDARGDRDPMWQRGFTATAADGLKIPGFRFDGSGKSFQTAAVTRRENGRGGPGTIWFQRGAAGSSSKSPARKAASAMIAKIPLPLSRYIAATFRPLEAAE